MRYRNNSVFSVSLNKSERERGAIRPKSKLSHFPIVENIIIIIIIAVVDKFTGYEISILFNSRYMASPLAVVKLNAFRREVRIYCAGEGGMKGECVHFYV